MNKTLTTLLFGALAVLPFASGAGAYDVIVVSDGGTVSGKVSFSKADPPPKVFSITKDNATCGTGNREVDFVRVNNGALTDAVVFLDKVKSGKAWSTEVDSPAVDQKACDFIPYFQVMRNGDTLPVTNSDPVLHNIHTYEILGRAKKTVFNVSQPPTLARIDKTVKLRRGAGMKLECDAHDFMHGFIFVAKSPYYAVVAEDGSFSIGDVPPGTYTVKAWHGFLGEKKGSVTVDAGGNASIDLKF
jgi:hypothetical protein